MTKSSLELKKTKTIWRIFSKNTGSKTKDSSDQSDEFQLIYGFSVQPMGIKTSKETGPTDDTSETNGCFATRIYAF